MTDFDIEDIQETATEARTSFSLRDRLMGRSQIEREVTVFTDEVSAERYSQLKVLIEAARLVEQPEEDIEALEAELKEVAREVYSTGLTFWLRAVPEIIVKDVRRKTKKNLKIKGPIPAERTEEYAEAFTATLLTKAVVKYKDHESGEVIPQLTFQEARDLDDYLPREEFKKLDNKLSELQYRNAISDAVTEDADF